MVRRRCTLGSGQRTALFDLLHTMSMHVRRNISCLFFFFEHITHYTFKMGDSIRQVWGAEGAWATSRAGIRLLLSWLQPSANLISACTTHHRMSVRLP